MSDYVAVVGRRRTASLLQRVDCASFKTTEILVDPTRSSRDDLEIFGRLMSRSDPVIMIHLAFQHVGSLTLLARLL